MPKKKNKNELPQELNKDQNTFNFIEMETCIVLLSPGYESPVCFLTLKTLGHVSLPISKTWAYPKPPAFYLMEAGYHISGARPMHVSPCLPRLTFQMAVTTISSQKCFFSFKILKIKIWAHALYTPFFWVDLLVRCTHANAYAHRILILCKQIYRFFCLIHHISGTHIPSRPAVLSISLLVTIIKKNERGQNPEFYVLNRVNFLRQPLE